MLKGFCFFLLLGLTVVSFAQAQGPSPYPPLTTCPLNDQTLTIAWIPKALNNPIFEPGRVGAETRAEELTEQGPCAVEVFYVAPLNTDAQAQVDIMQALIDLRYFDAIAVSCIDPGQCLDPINKAVAAGIPVITWDSDSPTSNRLTYLGINNYAGGQAAADLLVRIMGEQGKVALLSGVPGSLNLEDRIQGFRDEISRYPSIEIVVTVYSNDLATTGVDVVEAVMQDYPDLNGWFFVGMWPLFVGRGAMPRWEAASQRGDLVTVAFDTLPLELELMQDGYLHGLIGQKYWGWGYDTVSMLYEHILYGREFEDFTDSGMDIVTPLNVETMIEAWEHIDFSRPLPSAFDEDNN
ncbi:MAG: sugar-binding protein [Anaerolineales bacterium]|nr:sugar-binding protein [Anaerolineales bacterium]